VLQVARKSLKTCMHGWGGDSFCRRSANPTRATPKVVEGIKEPWKVATFEL
jgi:hypothetical protein